MSDKILTYVGKGGFILGVPSRDLSKEEIEKLALNERDLVESGLWVPVERESTPEPVEEIEDENEVS